MKLIYQCYDGKIIHSECFVSFLVQCTPSFPHAVVAFISKLF